MQYLIDTDVAIHLRDGTPHVLNRLADLAVTPAMSIITLVELLAGVATDKSTGSSRAALIEPLRQMLPILPFQEAEADAYGAIVAVLGFDRRKVLDRMIAAQAIVAGRTLITINERDFADVPGLDLEVWAAA